MRHIPSGTPQELDFEQALELFKGGRLEPARALLSELAAQFANDERVIGKLGYVEYELGNLAAAEAHLRRAGELDPSRELWAIGLFHSLWSLKRPDDAFAEARRYLALNPRAPEFNRLLEEMKNELGVDPDGQKDE